MNRKITGLLVSLLCLNIALAQNGLLDTTFEGNGIMIEKLGLYGSVGNQVAIQSDHKIVVAGTIVDSFGRLSIFRLKQDGSLDSSFHGIGYYKYYSSYPTSAQSLVIQPDGKIVVAGYITNTDHLPYFDNMILIRFNTDGSLDNSFGVQGVVKLNSPNNERINSVAVTNDGNFIVVGRSNYNTCLKKVLNDGSLDLTFGLNGEIVKNFGFGWSEFYKILLGVDGSLLAGGMAMDSLGKLDHLIIKFTPKFKIDSTGFAINGIFKMNFTPTDIVFDLALQQDGKIIAAGSKRCFRLLQNGILDSSFGFNGIINQPGYSTKIQPDGKILFSTIISDSFHLNLSIVRYNEDGALDYSFGLNGQTNTDVAHFDDKLNSIALQDDGKIVATGYAGFSNGQFIVTARYLSGLELSTDDFSTQSSPILVYPNPVSLSTTLKLNLDTQTPVTIQLYDLAGKQISTLLNTALPQGVNQEELKLPPGISPGPYLLQIQTNSGTATIKIIKQ
jgi:uncharacterized delta-60 repeat protein